MKIVLIDKFIWNWKTQRFEIELMDAYDPETGRVFSITEEFKEYANRVAVFDEELSAWVINK